MKVLRIVYDATDYYYSNIYWDSLSECSRQFLTMDLVWKDAQFYEEKQISKNLKHYMERGEIVYDKFIFMKCKYVWTCNIFMFSRS